MKQLVYSVLLAALLAGCAGTPSKEAAIEDRGIRATETTPLEGVRIVETGKTETRAAPSGASAGQTARQAGSGVETSGSGGQPVSQKALDSVKTQGVTTSGGEATPLPGSQGADGQSAAASMLPKPDAAPTWGDLTNPESPLSKRRLLFDFDSSAIRDEYRPVLEAHARFMQANKDARAILQGHADERGSREYNLALGQRRAESVLNAMNLLGVPEAQMEAVSFGEEKPVVEGHDEAAWQQNRRAEVVYQGE